jgi:acyl CoA:acetate/3-ketoacid CoA transferase beta subunit
MLVVAGARALAGHRVCFVGIGLPNIAVALAQRTVAPEIELIYESGVYGSRPERLPLSIGDPCLVTGAVSVMSMVELFQYFLQGGLVDVGFLGGAGARAARGWHGRGPSVVVTDLGRYGFDPASGEMRLVSVHPGVTLDEVRAATGWELRVADDLRTTPEPTAEELRLIREELDPRGVYVR